MSNRVQWELEQVGVENYKLAHAMYARAGISLARVPRRGWRCFQVPKSGPTCIILWASLQSLVDDYASIIADFAAKAVSNA